MSDKLPGIQQFDLTDRVAIVTGGTSGLGEAMASGLASAGANLIVTSRTETKAESAAKKLASDFDVKAFGVEANVIHPEDCQRVAEVAQKEFGRVDILINNAGINIRGAIEDLTYEKFREVQQINVDGMWLMSKAVVPAMKEQGSGRIINLGSTLGIVGLENRTPYASSKGAVVQMTRALGLELAKDGICVNAICPGPFLTPMNIPIADDEQTKKFIVGAVALERWGDLREIQGAAIFLASDAASYMVGSIITVDGGWTAR